MPSLVIPAAVRAVTAAITKARGCLTAAGLHAVGGPVIPPNPAGSTSADGEVVVSGSPVAVFVAFYTDAGKAQRLESEVTRNATRIGGQVERRGAVTVLWTRPPSAKFRHTVEACAFR
jgi:hypothetical protein